MRLRLRRRSAVVSLIAAGLLTLAACGQGWGLSDVGKGNGKTVNLTYALWDANQQVGYQKSIDIFEKQHPNIHVTIEQIPYGNYPQKLTSEYVSHDAPDLFWVNTPFLANWIQDGMVKDIGPLIKRDHVNMAQYYPALVKLHEHAGKIYGLPKDWDTIALYYNKDYFAQHHVKIPKNLTWKPDGSGTFMPMLKQATTDDKGRSMGTKGFDAGNIKTYALTVANDPQSGYGSFLAMNGAGVLAKPYSKKITLADPKAQQAFEYYTGLMNKDHVGVPAGEMGPEVAGSTATQLFAEGRVAIFQAGDWNTSTIASSVKFKVGVLPLPAGPEGRASVFNGLVDAINTASPHPKEAWELEKWLGSPASEKIMGEGGYIWPGIKSLDPLFLQHWKKEGIDLQPFLDEARGKVVNFPVSPGIAVGLVDMGNELGPMFLGSTSVADGTRNATIAGNHDLASFY